jgi:hypothetical protein
MCRLAAFCSVLADYINDVKPMTNLPENNVLTIQPRAFYHRYIELRGICILFSLIRHTNFIGVIMLVIKILSGEVLTIDGST